MGRGVVPPFDLSTPVGRLIDSVGFLVMPEGGGPFHNGALMDAANCLRVGEAIDWEGLVRWDALPAIRADLNELPDVPNNRPDPPETGQQASKNSPWHVEEPANDSPYNYRLEGEHAQQQLCEWIGIDRKTFVDHAERGRIYVQKTLKGRFRVWFRSAQQRAEANQRRLAGE